MKISKILFWILVFVISCNTNQKVNSINETFNFLKRLEVEKLNKEIYKRKIIFGLDVAKLYKPYNQEKEGNYSYNITEKIIDKHFSEIILIETGLLDDSIEGKKTVFLIKKNNEGIEVISIKENYRCFRGHENWSADKCN